MSDFVTLKWPVKDNSRSEVMNDVDSLWRGGFLIVLNSNYKSARLFCSATSKAAKMTRISQYIIDNKSIRLMLQHSKISE